MAALNERLRELRKSNKLTQKDIANHLGITESAYGYYEQGRNEPSFETLQKLADYFDTTVDYLLGREEEISIPPLLQDIDPVLAKRFVEAAKDPNMALFFHNILEASKEELEDLIRDFLKKKSQK